MQVSKSIHILSAAILIWFATILSGAAFGAQQPGCDFAADIALAAEDYPTAAELHRRLLKSEKNNALAHYHLGFAYGMMNDIRKEIAEYRLALRLGLNRWDVFLNLGLAYNEENRLESATRAFETAVSLGPEQAEAHFNLAIMYARADRLDGALREVTVSLVLDPNNLTAANTVAIIYANKQDFADARRIWTLLVQAAPFYAPARTNLTTLDRSCVETFRTCTHVQPEHAPLQ